MSENSASSGSTPCSPVHAALWSHPQAFGKSTPASPVTTSVIGFILALALSMEMATDGDGILSSHNGVLMKFFKSLHAINHYWYRTVFISKSVLGCLVLKFIGSSLVSLSHGKAPSWIDHPSYIISFLIAFCLVRSDSIEARELSGHMRYAAPATVALNLAAALYKMRSLSHLAEESDILGPLGTLVYGTLAFSACNALMVLEHILLPRLNLSAASEAAAKKTSTPNLRLTMTRHMFYLALLIASNATASRVIHSIAKVLVLGSIFANYNEGLLNAHMEPQSDHAVVAGTDSITPQESSPKDLLMATLHIPSPAKRPSGRSTTSTDQSLLGGPLIWLIGILSVGLLDIRGPAARVARPAVSLLRKDVTQHGGASTILPAGTILGAAATASMEATGANSMTLGFSESQAKG